MTKHTPGPWISSETHPHRPTNPGADICATDNTNVAIVFCDGTDVTAKQCAANARLIATSPRLLEAIKPLAFSSPDNPPLGVPPDDWKQAVLEARAALREAREG